MGSREPTVRSWELGEGLRQVMRHAGLLGWSESWVSRLLSGKRGATELDVAAFLGVCRVKGPERDRLLALCGEQHTPGWLQQHGSRLPKQLITLIDHESRAVSYSDLQPMLVPGLLQTSEYARAVISRNPNMPEPDGITWHISSYSANGSACVEVATTPDAVLVRDSKDREGPALVVPTPAWHAFLTALTR